MPSDLPSSSLATDSRALVSRSSVAVERVAPDQSADRRQEGRRNQCKEGSGISSWSRIEFITHDFPPSAVPVSRTASDFQPILSRFYLMRKNLRG
jgi:hypothetical protein